MESFHTPVLLEEIIEYLKPHSDQNFIDCTVGGGGHAQAILQRTGPRGILLGIDLDQKAIEYTEKKLAKYKNRLILEKENYKNLNKIINVYSQLLPISGILLDLGLSSFELRDPERGFSFANENAPLDMRFDKEDESRPMASDLLNKLSLDNLTKLFREYGEEKKARLIANEIISIRKKQKYLVIRDLLLPIFRIYKNPSRYRRHPATKVFQALRIAVNDELGNLKAFLPQAVKILSPGGKVAVISYHSLEDRIVKDFFKRESTDCICPEEIPKCACQHRARLKRITKKVIKPTQAEVRKNPRSRSARLRVAEKIK